jgi:DNA (cytosine-5)-methyltransferase 1
MNKLRLLDLFSGIGGFSLAARWTGQIETVQFVEIDPFCRKVLNKNFPGVPIHDDIRTFTYTTPKQDDQRDRGGMDSEATGWQGIDPAIGIGNQSIDILCGGFPCQPASVAGNRKGTSDDRWLWPEMLRVIAEVKPGYIIIENVPGLLTLDDGLVFENCCLALESEGYEVQTFIISACGVGAPHRRDRVWIVANSIMCPDRTNRGQTGEKDGLQGVDRSPLGSGMPSGATCHATDTSQQRLQRRLPDQSLRHLGQPDRNGGYQKPDWNEHWYEVATRLCRMDDGLPRRVDRVNRLKALGNAIVPQVAYQIFMSILKIEKGEE